MIKKILLAFLFIIIVIIYRNWFGLNLLSGNDWPFFYASRLQEFHVFPQAWGSTFGDGLGDNIIKFLWVETYLRVIVDIFVNKLNIPWIIVQRLFWLWPFLILLILSPFLFLKKILPNTVNRIYIIAGVFVFSLNTYILNIISGGQINLGLAYVFSPLVLSLFWNFEPSSAYDKSYIRHLVLRAFALALLISFDIRIACLAIMVIAMRVIFVIKRSGFRSKYFYGILISLLTSLSLHSFWILPQIIVKTPVLPPGYDDPKWLNFLSFADFSNAISLLHPFWPSNVFGVVSFLKPEFLFIPCMAYASLLIFYKRNSNVQVKQIVSFFTLVGIIGIFLAKGTKQPFGEIYHWLFTSISLFSLFRDPTKFYFLIVLSYLVLIPFGLIFFSDLIYNLKPQRTKVIQNTIIIFFIVIWLVLLKDQFLRPLTGALAIQENYSDYDKLGLLLKNQNNFSRTLWIPITHRFSYLTDIHPAVGANKLFKSSNLDDILHSFDNKQSLEQMQNLSIGYVIVPDDLNQDIFLTDRKYDDRLRQKAIVKLDQVSFLQKEDFFKKLAVYKVKNPKNHFYLDDGIDVMEGYHEPTLYNLKIYTNNPNSNLIFSEKYDRGWKAKIVTNKKVITLNSLSYHNINSFHLNKTGKYLVKIYYEPQKWIIISTYISLFILLLCGAIIFISFF